ncbi:hypothetical protein BJV74DRAFT_880287 [Russula compacta]|nr:hypothetical protein BJV74DRAFT_880287 [Russula compacta]
MFNHQKQPFKSALAKEKIPRSKSDIRYKRIRGGCTSANEVGLQHVQGKVDEKDEVFEPVAFFSAYTSRSSEQPQSLMNDGAQEKKYCCTRPSWYYTECYRRYRLLTAARSTTALGL